MPILLSAACGSGRLLAARNATASKFQMRSIDRAIGYYVNMTSPSGQVGYSGGIERIRRIVSRAYP